MISEIDKASIKSHFRSPYNLPEVISYIDEMDSVYEYEENNIKIVVYYRKAKDNPDFDLIRRVVKRGNTIIKNKKFKIILLLSSAKKEFNKNKNEPLSTKNTNSGFTYVNRNEIFIFRKEEFPKVIIHELTHHDTNIHTDYINADNKRKLLAHFNLDPRSNFILNEAIIELWATISHLSFVSKEYDIDFSELLEKELEYSLYKSHQLLHLKSPNNPYHDQANIYSYIIFKTIFFYHFLEFKKIYTFPYNDTKITNFLLTHSNLKVVRKNPSFNLKGKLVQRPSNSLCFMLFSDL